MQAYPVTQFARQHTDHEVEEAAWVRAGGEKSHAQDSRIRATFIAPGRPDRAQDVEGVPANYLSSSFAAPHLIGDRLAAFEADLRTELESPSPSGLFCDWPGDTEILLARKR